MSDKIKFYGGDNTIHRTNHVDVEVDSNGRVVGVWFRCSLIPFKATIVSDERANQMNKTYNEDIPKLIGVVFEDNDITPEQKKFDNRQV